MAGILQMVPFDAIDVKGQAERGGEGGIGFADPLSGGLTAIRIYLQEVGLG